MYLYSNCSPFPLSFCEHLFLVLLVDTVAVCVFFLCLISTSVYMNDIYIYIAFETGPPLRQVRL